MNRIIYECDRLQILSANRFSMKAVTPALVRMLYSTGVRIGEALNLKNMDVDLEHGVLKLYDTKNGRDRIVPMSQNMIEVCKDYMAFKERCDLGNKGTDLFFTKVNGLPFRKGAFRRIFKQILSRAGFYVFFLACYCFVQNMRRVDYQQMFGFLLFFWWL